ncbi:hypothetical protein ITP53_33985 [Nonomuraea sp. K274]|uniref:Solute-binding protein family 5 domain-containing protein n=1 Tax=Nonomuraea cypriaca TaxID=1187855 RepID=A0A931AHL5_9ACTN|nr:ABC transporter substrate-binding protein [Nonomuraea cypriaca]MBF8190638.1 hypothetical protein [Nonomuraea cypriaca]
MRSHHDVARGHRPHAGVVATSVIAVLLAAGCGTSEPASETAGETPVKGGELTVGLAANPDVLDPSLAAGLESREVLTHICESLYTLGSDNKPKPQLATDLPEWSKDGLKITIRLRTGVKFNDGTPFDAEAVKTSFERHMSVAGSQTAMHFDRVEKISTPDDQTVVLDLADEIAEPTTLFDYALAERQGGMIMSPAQLEKLGDKFGNEPVCVGPYKFGGYQGQDRIVIEKSDQYYDADKISIKRITYQAITDGAVRSANLRSGELDVALVDAADVDTVDSDGTLQKIDTQEFGYMGLTVNLNNADGVDKPRRTPDTAMASDPRLREAFDLAINRSALVSVGMGGKAVADCWPFSKQSPYYRNAPCPAPDIDRAKALLTEAGARTPVQVDLMTSTDSESLRLGQLIQSMTAQAGFAVKLRSVEQVTATEAARKGDFDVLLRQAALGADPNRIQPLNYSKADTNTSGNTGEEIDALLEEGMTTTDEARRVKVYQEAQDLVRERRNIIYLFHRIHQVRANPAVRGIVLQPDGLLRFAGARLTK